MIWALCYFTGLISCHCVSHSFSSSHSGLLAAFQTCKSCLPLRTAVLLFSLSGMSSPHILLRHSFISFRSMVKIAGGFPISSLPLFLLWVHWCTVIGPFSLTSLAAVCHYVAKFCSIKISSWIFFKGVASPSLVLPPSYLVCNTHQSSSPHGPYICFEGKDYK